MAQRDLSVLVVEDRRLQAEAIGAVLAIAGGFAVRLATTVREARMAMAQDPPDVVLVDVRLPDGDGIDLVSLASSLSPQVRACVLTGLDHPPTVARAIAAGASGYLLETETPEAVVATVRRVAAGEVVLPLAELQHLVASFRSESLAAAERQRILDALRPGEMETLQLLAAGLVPSAIARELGTSLGGVRRRLRTLYAKLAVSSRLQAVARARELDLLRDDLGPDRGRHGPIGPCAMVRSDAH